MRITAFFIGIACLVFYFPLAQAEEQPQAAAPVIQKEWIHAIAPVENSEVISKKPEVRVEFLETITLNTLVVLLDGTDITQLLTVTEKGFEYKPLLVLSSGMHTLSILATDKEGKQLQKNISFTTRHTKTLEEAYTSNEASVTYETALSKPDSATSIPHSKIEGNLKSDSKIKNKEWEFTFNTNLRYLDQSIPVTSPFKKGFDLANWLFTGTYSKEKFKFKASLGDIQVNETPYTVSSLARRGGLINLEYDIYQLNVFSVLGEQVYGLTGGTGIEGTTDNHILGVSGGVKLFDKKVEFKTIYVTGGEPGSSFGISTTSGVKKGDVIGAVLTSDFFENKMKTEFEIDFSKFDPDTSDEFKSKSDKAYKLKVGGFLGKYNYETMYEYIGRDYEAIGSQGLQKDKEGISLMNGLNLGVHMLNLTLSRYNDNVRGDELFPRIINYQGNLDYSFTKFPNLPMGINYQKSIQESTREPSGTSPIDLHTDTITGRINYIIDKINLGFQTAYSLLNDRTVTNNDTTTITYSFIPAYTTPKLIASSSFSLNQSKVTTTDVRTDTYTISPSVTTKFLRDKASCNLAGTYSIIKADNGSANSRNLNANFTLGYSLKEYFKGYLDPTISLKGSYLKNTDKVNSSLNKDEFILFLVLATTMPFSF